MMKDRAGPIYQNPIKSLGTVALNLQLLTASDESALPLRVLASIQAVCFVGSSISRRTLFHFWNIPVDVYS